MGTVPTTPTVEDQLVTKFTTALATASSSGGQVPVDIAWPGPSSEPVSVFIGFHPSRGDIPPRQQVQIAAANVDRKQREENYTIPVTIWAIRPDLTPHQSKVARDQAWDIAGKCEDVLADDPRIGLSAQAVVKVSVSERDYDRFPLPKNSGWVCEIVLYIDVQARLT